MSGKNSNNKNPDGAGQVVQCPKCDREIYTRRQDGHCQCFRCKTGFRLPNYIDGRTTRGSKN